MGHHQAKHDIAAAGVDDEAVIKRVLGGDADAFGLLMTKYEAMVINRVKYHVPENALQDTVQEAFVRAYRSLATCRKREKFKSWLGSIAVKTAYDWLRKRYRCRETSVSALSSDHHDWLENVSVQRSKDEYERQLARREAGEVLAWALDQLPPRDRMVLELVHLQERSVKEAARLLGWSVVNVKVRSHRSRKKLKAILDDLAVREREGP
ncbi:RNA polymerase sigma factor [Desulfosarcina alkanivorans]|nr:sigma-70 family RNA polymerase sigma factor [Desulfosarcina alkanivorans]